MPRATRPTERFRSDQWLDKYEAAERIGGYQPETVVRHARAGKLPGVKRGGFKRGEWFFPVEAVDAFKIGDVPEMQRISKLLPTAVVPQFRPALRPSYAAKRAANGPAPVETDAVCEPVSA